MILKKICLAVFAAGLSSCALTPQVASITANAPQNKFKYDLSGDVNGYQFQGVGVIPLNPDNEYTLNVNSQTSVDMITITTCHRDWSDQDMPIEVGKWFKPNHGFTFKFNLTHGIEDVGTCLLRIGAYNKEGNPQAWAVIDFITEDSSLPAYNKCDGDQGATHGVSMCQSKAGLDEEIDFDVPVEIADSTSPACKPKIPKDGKHWIYVLPNQECVVYFMESAAPHRFHRHTFFGYSSIQLKSE
jgi:hypothetical protein